MPEITRFYGIVIKIFFKPKEHEPSHFHALYGEYIGEFNIQTMEMIQGDLPKRHRSWSENGWPSIKALFKTCGTNRQSTSCPRCCKEVI